MKKTSLPRLVIFNFGLLVICYLYLIWDMRLCCAFVENSHLHEFICSYILYIIVGIALLWFWRVLRKYHRIYIFLFGFLSFLIGLFFYKQSNGGIYNISWLIVWIYLCFSFMAYGIIRKKSDSTPDLPDRIHSKIMSRKRCRYAIRVTGIILILLGVCSTYYWYIWLRPEALRSDSDWYYWFSEKGLWKYMQHRIISHGWKHGDSFYVGRYGNIKWAEWIMKRAIAGNRIYGCELYGHRAMAMEFIINQDPAKDHHDIGVKKWIEWWKQNKDKSQVEWIKQGFEKYGVKVNESPTLEETTALLMILGDVKKDYIQGNSLSLFGGEKESEKKDPRQNNTESEVTENADNSNVQSLFGNNETPVKKEKVYTPEYMKYNAFRWLRDSGFDVISYTINHANKSSSPQLIEGLKRYHALNSVYPWNEDVGILLLPGRNKGSNYKEDRPKFFDTEWQLIGHCLMIVPTILGLFLIYLSSNWRKKKLGTACLKES